MHKAEAENGSAEHNAEDVLNFDSLHIKASFFQKNARIAFASLCCIFHVLTTDNEIDTIRREAKNWLAQVLHYLKIRFEQNETIV